MRAWRSGAQKNTRTRRTGFSWRSCDPIVWVRMPKGPLLTSLLFTIFVSGCAFEAHSQETAVVASTSASLTSLPELAMIRFVARSGDMELSRTVAVRTEGQQSDKTISLEQLPLILKVTPGLGMGDVVLRTSLLDESAEVLAEHCSSMHFVVGLTLEHRIEFGEIGLERSCRDAAESISIRSQRLDYGRINFNFDLLSE